MPSAAGNEMFWLSSWLFTESDANVAPQLSKPAATNKNTDSPNPTAVTILSKFLRFIYISPLSVASFIGATEIRHPVVD
jgi:hypothetical protein